MNKPKPLTKKRRPSHRLRDPLPKGRRQGLRSEFSAGGIVQDGDRLLMVKVENLEGKQTWTFPKGHLEAGETEQQAAIREVEEETGFRCEIVKPFERVEYFFKREGVLIKKQVSWFLIESVRENRIARPERNFRNELGIAGRSRKTRDL